MDCHNELEDIVKRCQKLGLTCIAIADHDAVEGGLELQKIAPFKVIVAEEVQTYNGEVMGMFLKKTYRQRHPLAAGHRRHQRAGRPGQHPSPL